MNAALDTPLVSVVVPAHNAAAFIGEAIVSLRAQTLADWEAIVVDDGSTDGTPQLLASLAAAEPRLRMIRQANAGVSAARNVGIAAARADWLLFLDADDWLTPDALERLVEAARADPAADVIHAKAVRVLEGGGHVPGVRFADGALFDRLSQSNVFDIHTCLVRRARAIEVGAFDPRLSSCEDLDLWQRLARAGVRFRELPRVVAYYRQRPGSLSRDHAGLLRNWLEVIGRAHRADPRVAAPVPRHAAGAPPDEMALKAFIVAAWCGAGAVAAGQDAAPLLDQLGGLRAPDLDAQALAVTAHDGLLFTRAESAPDWHALWPIFGSRLVDLLERLGQRSGAPLLGVRARRRLARHIAEGLAPDPKPVAIDRLHVEFIDLRQPIADVVAAPGTDRVYCPLMLGGERVGLIEAPVLSRIAAAWLRGQIEPRFYRPVLEQELRRPSRRFVRRGVLSLAGRAGARFARSLAADLRCGSDGARTTLRIAVRRHLVAQGAVLALAAPTGPSWYDDLRRLYDEEMARPASAEVDRWEAIFATEVDRWEAIFATEDPWGYSSGYEQTKYERTLALLPDRAISRALELACAEGHFSVQLAPRVARLLATDISETALRRAAQRCTGVGNVEFRRLDFSREPIPGGFDIIVCSEVLYFMGDEAALATVARRIADALAPGGTLLMAHARTCADERYETAFDWGTQIGVRTITQAFEPIRSLALEREIRTPLYRVQRWRRRDPEGPPPPAPEAIEVPIAREELTRELAQMVRWRGPGNQPAAPGEVEALPILMYHRIARDAPPALQRYSVAPERLDEQLHWLRRNGRHAITLDDWRLSVARRERLQGRPVLITFDDGYRDFRDEAWPILRRHGMSATVFLVADRIGGAADWDAHYGTPAPLLTADDVAMLRDEGIDFGAHGVSHRPMTGLSTEELVREGLRSRATIEGLLRAGTRAQRGVTAIAYPHGDQDGIVRMTMRDCGFEIGFAGWPGLARLDGDPMNVPRIEITADDDIAAFAAKVGA